jgi:hypothetical protein
MQLEQRWQSSLPITAAATAAATIAAATVAAATVAAAAAHMR